MLVIKFLLAWAGLRHEFGVEKERMRFYHCEFKNNWLKSRRIRYYRYDEFDE